MFRLKVTIILLMLLVVSCAAFQGNTRKKFGDFDIEERQMYQRHLNERADSLRRKDHQALQQLRQDKSIKTPQAPVSSKERTIRNDEEPERPWLIRQIRKLFRVKDEI